MFGKPFWVHITLGEQNKIWGHPKAELRQSFSMCVYCMHWRFQSVTLVGSNQHNYFENANACSKHTLKATVTTQLNQPSCEAISAMKE